MTQVKTEPASKEVAILMVKKFAESQGISLKDLMNNEENEVEPQKEFYSIKKAAELLQLSPDTIKRRIKDGSLKAKKLNPARNGSVRIERSSLNEWLKHCPATCKKGGARK